MAGVFKKLSANDIKITPFEAHKTYSTTNLSSIGARTDFVSWAPYNKFYFNDDNRKYYQIDKLYYRDYVKDRAHRLELDDATYTTQERRLYEYANVLSLSQKTFGSEVQPGTFILSCSYSSSGELFHIKDDGFGNLYDVNEGKDNFPNEDNRLIYLGPTQAFKRRDLTINYETGKKYVNSPFRNGYTRTVYDDSYFVNEVEFHNVNFVTSSNSGFNAVKVPPTSGSNQNPGTEFFIPSSSVTVASGTGFVSEGVSLLNAVNTSDPIGNSLFDNNPLTGVFLFPGGVPSGTLFGSRAGYLFDLKKPRYITSIEVSDFTFNNNPYTTTGPWRVEISTDGGNTFTIDQEYTFSTTNFLNEKIFLKTPKVNTTHLRFSAIDQGANPGEFWGLSLGNIRFFEHPVSKIQFPHQPQFNFETDEDFTINFRYDLNKVDHNNSTKDGDYYILTKEGNKTVASLPSEKTQDVSLRKAGSSQVGTAPIGNQFPYRIYYKGNHPNANTASLFFERSDGEKTQFVSSSFFTSGSDSIGDGSSNFLAFQSINGVLKIITTADKGSGPTPSQITSTDVNSPTLTKTVSNKANITLYNKPTPNGSYSNNIGQGGGQISQLMMWNKGLSSPELTNVFTSVTGTPNIGNMFYDNGFAVITHPSYKNVLNTYDFNGYTSVTSASISCSVEVEGFDFTRPSGGSFNDDGTKLILTSDQTDTTVEFTLSTPFDVTSITTSRSFRDENYGSNNQSLIFNNDGSKVYLNRDNTIKSFALSSSYDLKSKHNPNDVTITTPNSDNLRSIAWSNDGTKFFTGTVEGNINQYTAKDPFDLDDILYDYTYNVKHEGDIQGIRFDNSGYKMFIIHTTSGGASDIDTSVWAVDTSYVTQYILDKPFELKSLNETNRFNSKSDIYQWGSNGTDDIKYPSEILFNNDGTKAYITLWSEAGGYAGNGSESDHIWQFDLPQHIDKFEYKNTHLITENEYQCTMTEDEFEFTTNPTIRKVPFSDSEDIANFATGSQFKPYVTSVGLYDDEGNLLVVGKLGQPIKASSETDTTFVIRFDT
jgi:hypothetical protein